MLQSRGRASSIEAMIERSAIFISYRRADTADVTARIHDRLSQAFGDEAVFIDVDQIPIGVDFSEHIETVLAKCRCMLAIIGPTWEPSHYVCTEIENALRCGVPIIPVLVNNAEMPVEWLLPTGIAALSKLNASRVRRNPDFHRDMDALIAALRDGALAGWVSDSKSRSPVESAAEAIWNDMSESTDTADLRRYADQFPGTREGLEARRRADLLAGQEAVWTNLRRDKIPEIRSFIASYPNHPRLPDAQLLLSALEARFAESWRTLQQSQDIESLKRFQLAAVGSAEEALAVVRIEYLRVIAPLEARELGGGALKAILADAVRRDASLRDLDERWCRELKQIEGAIAANANPAHNEPLMRLLAGKKEQLRQLAITQRTGRA